MTQTTTRVVKLPIWCLASEPVESWLVTAVAALPVGGIRLHLRDFKHITLDAGWSSGIHRHQYHEIDILLTGHGETATVPVQRLGPGNYLLHGTGVPHAWRALPGFSCDVLSIGFTADPAIHLTLPARWPLSSELVAEARLLLNDMQQQLPGWCDRLPLRIGAILSTGIGLLTDASRTGHAHGSDRLEALDRYLHDHLHELLTLDQLAEHLCISRRTLTRLLREQTGSTVMDRLRTFRLVHAAELLRQTNLSLAEIAERTGFAQSAYFTRCFCRHFNCPPARYRRQLRINAVL